MHGASLRHRPEGDSGDDRSAPTDRGLDRQRSTDEHHPLPHPEQAKRAAR